MPQRERAQKSIVHVGPSKRIYITVLTAIAAAITNNAKSLVNFCKSNNVRSYVASYLLFGIMSVSI